LANSKNRVGAGAILSVRVLLLEADYFTPSRMDSKILSVHQVVTEKPQTVCIVNCGRQKNTFPDGRRYEGLSCFI
jgi:hypothetical protein